MVAMAKKPKQKQARTPAWAVNVRLDPELEALIAAYQDRQTYRPTLAQVVERGLRLVLDEEAKTSDASANK